jgi:hypothetical protein
MKAGLRNKGKRKFKLGEWLEWRMGEGGKYILGVKGDLRLKAWMAEERN